MIEMCDLRGELDREFHFEERVILLDLSDDRSPRSFCEIEGLRHVNSSLAYVDEVHFLRDFHLTGNDINTPPIPPALRIDFEIH